jgi:hypothetical protein
VADLENERLQQVDPLRTAPTSMPDWKEIELDVSIYKFYLELLLKGTTLVLILTGGIVSYVLAHSRERLVRFALVLPMLVNAGFAAICGLGYRPAVLLAQDHKNTSERQGIAVPYEFSPLVHLLVLSAIVYGAIAIGLGVLIAFAGPG